MLRNTEKNVVLSDEQTKQLHEFYSRLTNLQTETSIATKNLESIKQENLKATLEKQYLEGVISTLKEQVKKTTQQVDEHVQLVSKSQDELTKHRKERGEIDTVHKENAATLSKREKEVAQLELEYVQKKTDITNKSKTLSDERLAVEKAKEAFQKAIESVVWK